MNFNRYLTALLLYTIITLIFYNTYDDYIKSAGIGTVVLAKNLKDGTIYKYNSIKQLSDNLNLPYKTLVENLFKFGEFIYRDYQIKKFDDFIVNEFVNPAKIKHVKISPRFSPKGKVKNETVSPVPCQWQRQNHL